VVFFSGNTAIKHINRYFIGTKMVKMRKLAGCMTYRWHATGSQFCVAACSVHVRGQGVEMNECIIHMRQGAFLPVKGVGLTPHVPGLKGAPLPEK